MSDEELVRIRQIAKEVFWEVWDSELLPLLKDFISVKVETATPKTEVKDSLLENTFNILKWENEKGVRLGHYQVAYKQQNIPDKWNPAFNILRANNSLIANRFHEANYLYAYWIYPEKYSDRIFRKKLSEAKG